MNITYLNKMLEVAESATENTLVDVENPFDLRAAYIAKSKIFILGYQGFIKPFSFVSIQAMAEESEAEMHNQFNLCLMKLCENFEVYYEEMREFRTGIRDLNGSLANINQLHDGLADLVLFASTLDHPTNEQLEKFQKVHQYFKYRKDLSESDLLSMKEKLRVNQKECLR